VNRFPYDNSAKFPYARFCDFHKGSNAVALMLPKCNRTNGKNIYRSLPFLKFGIRTKVHALCVGFAPRFFSEGSGARLFGVLIAKLIQPHQISKTKASLGAETSAVCPRRFDEKCFIAVFTLLLHKPILPQKPNKNKVFVYCSRPLFDLLQHDNLEQAG
jgi:hypothetical protein